MSVDSLIGGLALSPDAKILSDATQPEFLEALARWSDVDRKQPHVIVFPATEEDLVKTVKAALAAEVPFVPKSGGHSIWSTIGQEGFILDVSLLKEVNVDAERQTAIVSAGANIKDVTLAAWEKGYVVAAGNVNSTGYIPSSINGGLTPLAPLIGFGSDNVISARVITASGDLITVSETENPELLYAFRGAGQFFGVVVSLTVKVHPSSILGPDGTVYSTTCFFPTDKAVEVARATLELHKNGKIYAMTGVLATPPAFDPVIIFVAIYLGSQEEAEKALKEVTDLGPSMTAFAGQAPFSAVNDSFAAFEIKGGYKRWLAPGLTSLDEFKPEDMKYLVELQAKVQADIPGAKPTGFIIEFTSDGPFHSVPEEKETAFAHRDVKVWVHLLSWGLDDESGKAADALAHEGLEYVRRNQPREQHSFYGNFSRSRPIEELYKGADRLKRLADLKKKWDPKGIFTKAFL